MSTANHHDNELDAILDQLCALQTQFDLELGKVNDENGHENGHSVNGHSVNGHSVNGHSVNDNSVNGHENGNENGHSVNGHGNLSDDSGSGSITISDAVTSNNSFTFTRQDSIRSSSTSSSSGWMSERGSNVSTPTIEQFTFNVTNTIKRKPNSVPKIPLTTTTRNLAMHSDDALVDVDSSSSEDEPKGSKSKSKSNSTNGFRTTRATLKNGTLRRSSTEERFKCKNNIYDSIQRYQTVCNDNHHYNHVNGVNNNDKVDILPDHPSTNRMDHHDIPSMNRMDHHDIPSTNRMDHHFNERIIDELPLPPPPQVLTSSLSTLSLNLPPPPPEIIHAHFNESSFNRSSPMLYNNNNNMNDNKKYVEPPQVPPKPTLNCKVKSVRISSNIKEIPNGNGICNGHGSRRPPPPPPPKRSEKTCLTYKIN